MKRYLAPFTIILVMIAIVLFISILYVTIFNQANLPIIFNIIILVIAAALIGALVYTFVHRIHEIKKEDPDDFSKY